MGKKDRFWVGFDLGGTKMLTQVFNSQFECLGRSRTKTKGFEGSDAGLSRIVKTIREALDKADLAAKDLAGIGVGCPGPLDLDRGIMQDAPNLGWSNVYLKDHLEEEFDCEIPEEDAAKITTVGEVIDFVDKL